MAEINTVATNATGGFSGTSDYRGASGTHQQDQTTTTQRFSRPLYSQVSDNTFPKKDQAIVMNSTDGLTIYDYSAAIGNIIDPANILFVSRISNSRVCMYFKNQGMVDNLIDEQKTVDVKSHALTIRPLISKSKKIILSNVCPVIPHYVTEKKLSEYDVKLESKINFLRAGMNDNKFAHILSFQRQVFII